MLKIVATIKWLCIIVGSIGAVVAAAMHFKIQNDTSVVPIKNVTAKIDAIINPKRDTKVSVPVKLDPAKLMNQNEVNQIIMKTGAK